MSKNKHVIPPEILGVLGPPPLLASENPKRWKETLARYAQSYPPKNADDFEGWRNLWNLACDHWEEERMKRFKVEVLEAPRRAKLEQEFLASTTLADLFTLLFAANPFSAARASLWRWSSDELEDGLAHGGQCRSRRRPVDSFFPALLF